jgi:2-pyrone-4,6-dicarboxylate lactonase
MQTLDREHSAPAQALPAGAADCHMHVFGPFDRFPLAPQRAYNVPEAPLAAHERMKRQVGLERTVFVQASGCGTDNRAMLAALAEAGPRGRGVAVVEAETPLRELQQMHKAGVRGIRLNLRTHADRYPVKSGGDHASYVERFARQVAPLGWHLQFFADGDTLAALEGALSRAAVEVVIDHMGLPDSRAGLDQPGFQALLRLLKSGRAWAKLAGADRITRATGNLRDAIPYLRALAEAAPDRLVWGSDWPNIGFNAGGTVSDASPVTPHRELDAGELLDVLAEAVPDVEVRRGILAANPERLYGFAPA